MFIFTAKFSRKKAIAIVLALAVILAAIVLLAGRRDGASKSRSTENRAFAEGIEGQEDVAAYLTKLGWIVSPEPLEVQQILIPREFPPVYERYNMLQKSQGFDLLEYAGFSATRYTYEVLNYPGGDETIIADVIVENGTVIGGDIQSLRLDGFMHGLISEE